MAAEAGFFVQDLGVANDGVERRAQLVAHVREELRLVLARLSQLLALLLKLDEKPRILDSDDRLVCECLNQCDLLLGERLVPRAASEQ